MKNLFRTAVGAALALGLPAPGGAQQTAPLITDRPDFTESASTVAPGRFQFELGYTFTRAGVDEQHDFGELLARIGILPWLEGRLALNSFAQLRSPETGRSGLEDVSIGFKALVYRKPEDSSAAVPQVALLFGADLPTGEQDFGASEVQPGAKVILSWDLTDRLVLASNIGWAYLSTEDGRFNQGVGSVVVGYGISDPLVAYLEWYGFFPENRGGGSSDYLNGGFGWLLSPNVQLDWRIGVGLQEPDPNWFTGAGISFRL